MATYEEKELIAATLNGLESYAKEIAQDAWEPLIKIRRIIKEMSSYWDMQEEKDWERSFDNHVLLSYFDQKAEPVPDEEKKRVIQGLVHYIEESIRELRADQPTVQEPLQKQRSETVRG